MRASWKGTDIASMRKEIGAPGSIYTIAQTRRIKSSHSKRDHWEKIIRWIKKIMSFPSYPKTKKKTLSFDVLIFITKL